MCTVVVEWAPGEWIHILALRDELTTRDFDLPGRWWPAQPGVVGGRDRSAGGSWCVTDVDSGTTALVLNRAERREGSPSRGGLPLAAVRDGDDWSRALKHETMASFNLLLASPTALTAWTWDAHELRRVELDPGTHMVTSAGVDAADAKTVAFAPRFAKSATGDAVSWRDVVAANPPSDEPGALVVRHPVDGGGVWATVFGQLLTTRPGELVVEYSRSPWRLGTWTRQSWPSGQLES